MPLNVKVAHYGALRGSNAYQAHDVILAQVYHPNLEQVVREGRALFADDETPLDERIVLANTRLHDATGAAWQVSVPTFADPRLAALLAQRREAELLQCALRGRPFDHPDTQITLLFSLPVPGLEPTLIVEAAQSPESNAGREAAAKARLCAAAQQLLDRTVRVIDVHRLASAAHASVRTVRKHWAHIAARLHLRMATRRERAAMPRGGARVFARMVLLRRGRWVPRRTDQQPLEHGPATASATGRSLAAYHRGGDPCMDGQTVDTQRFRIHRLLTPLGLCSIPLCTRASHRPGGRSRDVKGWEKGAKRIRRLPHPASPTPHLPGFAA